ncbi:MAG: bifunctional N-acetylglucosamine-1-phosphate uridyltransferase/glucosamine-1-phosphate acetyltransferase [Candidatus Omnitrophica bacterium]|nr:bifunctional N-acetylglucosamine-1-phosphate uridyltransferase/glucosamine-1-phosphate acetyltransferase [Candidatus Omnitrophota bacterium]
MKITTAVILAAGLGTRMKSEIPKVLHSVGSSTVLGKVVTNLKKAGIKNIIAVVGYKAELIEKQFKGELKFVTQKELLGSGDALKQALDALDEGCPGVLVTCGDTVLITSATYEKLASTHLNEKASCTLLTASLDDPHAYGRIVRGAGGDVEKVIEEKDASREEKKIREINVGSYCFNGPDLEKFIHDIEINEKKKEFYLTDIVNILVSNGKTIASAGCEADEAIGINSRKDLAVVNNIINKKTLEKNMDSGVTVVDTETTFIDETAKIGKDTIIYPNTVIEGDVEIGSGCKIGPFARLRPGTKVSRDVEIGNFVEMTRTEVGEGTKIKHHAYLGDARIGRNVNIGSGTMTANYDGKNKNRTEIEDNVLIGVGAILIAPVKIGKGAQVGAGSVVTKNKNVAAGATVAGIPAKAID